MITIRVRLLIAGIALAAGCNEVADRGERDPAASAGDSGHDHVADVGGSADPDVGPRPPERDAILDAGGDGHDDAVDTGSSEVDQGEPDDADRTDTDAPPATDANANDADTTDADASDSDAAEADTNDAGATEDCEEFDIDGPCYEPPLLQCADLHCELEARRCVDGDDETSASCGDCLDGHHPSGDACIPNECDFDEECATIDAPWSECSGVDLCARSGEQERTVTSRQCVSGICVATGSAVEVESCSRETNHSPCESGGACIEEACVLRPDAVDDPTATIELSDRVVVRWSADDRADGYEVEIDDSGVWRSVGDATEYVDLEARPPRIEICTGSDLTASQGTFATHVALRCDGAIGVAGDARRYRVRAINVAGEGPPSAAVDGHTGLGPLEYQWQLAPSAEGPFADLVDATEASFDDPSAPSRRQRRWYRVSVGSAGVPPAISSAVTGHRAYVGLGTRQCTRDEECMSETCVVGASGALGSCLPQGFVLAPAGTFMMGSLPTQAGRRADEAPAHLVTITRPFSILATEATQHLWWEVMATSPSYYAYTGECAEPDCPVETVSWYDVITFMNELSLAEGLGASGLCYESLICTGTAGGGCPGDSPHHCTGDHRCNVAFLGLDCRGFRLPTEAEWEYAYRAGTTTTLYNGEFSPTTDGGYHPLVDAIGWTMFDGAFTRPVGLKLPNDWGIYDMAGNVYEWAWDVYQGDYYAISPAVDPLGPATGDRHVLRGGSAGAGPQWARAAARQLHHERVRTRIGGFRPVMTMPP